MSGTNKQACHKWLAATSRKDDYLGRRDQQPEINRQLVLLKENLQRLEKDLASRFARLFEEVGRDLEKQKSLAQEARAAFEKIFEELRDAPHNAATNLRASRSIDQQIHLLSRRMRPRLLHTLDRLSPGYKILEKPFNDIEALRLNCASSVSEFFWVLRARKPGVETAGKTVFELAVEPRLEEFCQSPSLLLLQFRRLKWRCRREYKFLHLPVREIVLESLTDLEPLNPAGLIEEHHKIHEELQQKLATAWQSIRFNFETGASELDEMAEDLRSGKSPDLVNRADEIATMLLEVLDKSLIIMEEVPERYREFLESVNTRLHQDHERILVRIEDGIQNPSRLGAYLRWWLHAFRRGLINWYTARRKSVSEKISSFGDMPLKNGGFGEWYFTFISRFRKQSPIKESLLKLTDIPSEAELLEQAKAALPPIYRRLFQNAPLHNREFLLGMDNELSLLAETYQRWCEGKAASVAVIGPEGSGKTSLLNCFANEIEGDSSLLRATLHHRLESSADVIGMVDDLLGFEEPTESVAELVGKIVKLEPRVVFVEDGHLLFLRALGAREALETFFYIMMSTRAQLFWVVTFRLNPWLRISYLHHAEQYFTHVISTEFHNEEELREALLLRQRTAGQTPVFSAEGVSSYKLNKFLAQDDTTSAEAQKLLADHYFSNLYDLSGGNMQTALYYWLRSLSLGDNNELIVKPCVKVDTAFIKGLDSLYLLTLAEVLAHGGMTPKEHGEIFRVDDLRSRLVLDYLRQIRLLKGSHSDRRGQPQSYIVNPIFYQPVYSALTSMHYLY